MGGRAHAEHATPCRRQLLWQHGVQEAPAEAPAPAHIYTRTRTHGPARSGPQAPAHTLVPRVHAVLWLLAEHAVGQHHLSLGRAGPGEGRAEAGVSRGPRGSAACNPNSVNGRCPARAAKQGPPPSFSQAGKAEVWSAGPGRTALSPRPAPPRPARRPARPTWPPGTSSTARPSRSVATKVRRLTTRTPIHAPRSRMMSTTLSTLALSVQKRSPGKSRRKLGVLWM